MANENEILEAFTNVDDGVQSRVVKMSRGFAVILRDTDAEMDFPDITIYKTVEPAIEKAYEISGLGA